MRRLFLLPVALLALSLSGCDSGPLAPTGDGMQAHTNAPTASLLGSISGPTTVGFNCSAFYYYNDEGSETEGYFQITSGGQYASIANQLGNYAEVQTGSSQGDFTLAFKDTGGSTLASRNLEVRSYGECPG